jgi:ZIP family zinc transporter
MANPSFGVVMAIAMALHNFPEAIAISVPMYNATNQAFKSFMLACAPGVVQLMGAGLGMLLFETVGFSQLAQGIVYGECKNRKRMCCVLSFILLFSFC